MDNKFINSETNDSFVRLKGLDLQELLLEIDNYLLEYRNLLYLPNDVTFGIELEYENVSKEKVDNFIKTKLQKWNSKGDDSLSSGGEVTSPIIIDDKKYWKELKLVCDYLNKENADTSHNAGGHIHIGAHVLGNNIEAWKDFIKLYTVYENVIFRFVYGDKISARHKQSKYAPPTANELYSCLNKINELNELKDLRKYLPLSTSYNALHFGYVKFYNADIFQEKNTIEFRSPNASTNAIVWQNNINAFAKMLVSSREKVMDIEFLDYKLKNEFKSFYNNKYLYNEINLKNAFEFVDLIFDNNLDKIYFLKQYLKNFENNYGLTKAVKAKRFTK